MSGARAAHLLSAARLLDDPPDRLVLLDIRSGADRTAYLRGHLPGARLADLDADLAAPPGPHTGDRPLPEPGALTAALRRWGIHPDSTVVVYDDARTVPAARAWWVLRWAGLTDVRVLDGGLSAWRAVGGELVTGPEHAEPGTAVARPGALPVVDTTAVAALPARGILLDARPRDHFRGHGEFPGHIPEAVSAPVFDDLDQHGLLRDEHTLRARYGALGLIPAAAKPPTALPGTPAAAEHGTARPPSASYCGSGMAAALQVFVLATLGVEAALYPGSLSQWTADPDRPLVRETSVPSV